MWLLFLANALTWSTISVPSGSPWANTGLITCSGSSFAYSNTGANGFTYHLLADASAWKSPAPPMQFEQGNLEVFVWSLTSGSVLNELTVDSTPLLAGNTTFPLPTTERKLVFSHNASLPRSLRFQVRSTGPSTILFSCVQFRARYENVSGGGGTTGATSGTTGGAAATSGGFSTTTGGTTTGDGTTTTTSQPAAGVWPGLEWNPQGGTQERGPTYYVDECLVVLNVLIFLLYWAIPARVRLPDSIKLSQIVRKSEGYFLARNLNSFYVVGYSQKEEGAPMSPHPGLVGELFCPFIGVYDKSYQVFAIGNRIPLAAALTGASFSRRLEWLASVAVILDQAHVRGIALGSLDSLWVDPVSQSIAISDYVGRDAPIPEDIHAFGRLTETLIGGTEDGPIASFIEACLSSDQPSARECIEATRYFISASASL